MAFEPRDPIEESPLNNPPLPSNELADASDDPAAWYDDPAQDADSQAWMPDADDSDSQAWMPDADDSDSGWSSDADDADSGWSSDAGEPSAAPLDGDEFADQRSPMGDDLPPMLPSSDDAAPLSPRKPGRARERHMRRKQRAHQHEMVQRRAVLPPARQLKPTGSFTMPKIKLPQARTPLYVVGSVLLVAVVLFFLSRFTGQDVGTPPNAVWLGAEWTYGLEEQRSRSLPQLIDTLRSNQVGTVYAWVSWLKEDDTWAGRTDLENNFNEVQPDVLSFVAAFKAAYPAVNLYGWVSVPAGEEPAGRDLSNPDVQQAVATFSRFVIDDLGFDGVFLNVEPVWDGDQNFISLLGVVRDTVGSDTYISVAIPPDWHPRNPQIPVPPLIAPGTEWSSDYKKSVALLVDELALMAYNSGLSSPDDYALWVAYQVSTYANTVSELDAGAGAGVQIMVGIPTYDSELPGHDALVENIPSAVRGIRQGIAQAGANAGYIGGLSIYAEWTTDDVEWAQFNLNWITGEQE